MSILSRARQRMQASGYQFPGSDPFGHYAHPGEGAGGIAAGRLPGSLGTTVTVPTGTPGQGVTGIVPLEDSSNPATDGPAPVGHQGGPGATLPDGTPVTSRHYPTFGSEFGLPNSGREGQRVNAAIDQVTGLPFGIASTLLNPRVVETSWGTDFNTGGGGIIGIGGELSRRNLERVYGRIQEDPEYGTFYAPGDLPGVNTPIAVHEGHIPGTRVVSGNTDLLPEGADVNGDGVIHAHEVEAWADPSSPQRVAHDEAAIRRHTLNTGQAAGTQAARDAEAARTAEAARIAREAAEATQREEEIRRAREAEEAARIAAERAAQDRVVIGQTSSGEDVHSNRVGSSVVTDRHGRAVTSEGRDGERVAVTVGDQSSDDSGGGGGGGRWCCSVMVHEGLWTKKELNQLTKWSIEFSKDHDWWLGGYNAWGKILAKKLVKGSPFWQSVVQAQYDDVILGKKSWKGHLAKAVTYSGAFVLGKMGAKAPAQFRLATKEELQW